MKDNKEAKELLYNVMKSYAKSKINETKKEIREVREERESNKKNGLKENVELGDTFEMKVTKH